MLFSPANTIRSGVVVKNNQLRKNIIRFLDARGHAAIADLAAEFHISIPKISSTLHELMEEGWVGDQGKTDSTGGRRASQYGLLADAGFFLGVEVSKYNVTIGLLDFKKNLIRTEHHDDFLLENTKESLQHLIRLIKQFISKLRGTQKNILRIGMNLPGRINYTTGHSHSYYHFDEEPLTAKFEKAFGIQTYLDNDTRAMAFGEFHAGIVNHEKNILFINLDYGIGVGIMINGELYYGKSGFSGEFGHIPFFNNEIICHCGKKGCLETEASGSALVQLFRERRSKGATSLLPLKGRKLNDVSLEEIVNACLNDDTLAIECMACVAEKLGKGIAILINLFNPQLVVLGGLLSAAQDHIRLPIRSALNKYSLSLVNNDTRLEISQLGRQAGVTGACLLVRAKMLSAA